MLHFTVYTGCKTSKMGAENGLCWRKGEAGQTRKPTEKLKNRKLKGHDLGVGT